MESGYLCTKCGYVWHAIPPSSCPKCSTHPLQRLVGKLKANCNRYANGQCSTVACLNRGGYKRGTKPNYDKATCESHEELCALEPLLANNELKNAGH